MIIWDRIKLPKLVETQFRTFKFIEETIPSKFLNRRGADSALMLGYLSYMIIYTAVKEKILNNYLNCD